VTYADYKRCNDSLAALLKPDLTPPERAVAGVEGWILGGGLILDLMDLPTAAAVVEYVCGD
jgi:hypothetical protein